MLRILLGQPQRSLAHYMPSGARVNHLSGGLQEALVWLEKNLGCVVNFLHLASMIQNTWQRRARQVIVDNLCVQLPRGQDLVRDCIW